MVRHFSTSIVFGLSALVSACSSPPPPVKWTMQPIERATSLRPGMSESEVVGVMGNPITREFQANGSVLQWCKTGTTMQFPVDRFVIGFFYKDVLVGTRNYTGPSAAHGAYGDCSIFYKTIEWRPSDRVIEYRFR